MSSPAPATRETCQVSINSANLPLESDVLGCGRATMLWPVTIWIASTAPRDGLKLLYIHAPYEGLYASYEACCPPTRNILYEVALIPGVNSTCFRLVTVSRSAMDKWTNPGGLRQKRIRDHSRLGDGGVLYTLGASYLCESF